MTSKKDAQKQARELRKMWPLNTVNVKEISKGNWGVRMSPKGKRDMSMFDAFGSKIR